MYDKLVLILPFLIPHMKRGEGKKEKEVSKPVFIQFYRTQKYSNNRYPFCNDKRDFTIEEHKGI